MTTFNASLDFIITDNDYTLITALDLAMGVPESAFFVIKENFWDADEDAIITKTITTVESDDGVVGTTTDVEATTVPCTFYLAPEDTHLLSPYFKYVYAVRYKTDEDKYFTQEEGTLIPKPGITAVQ